MKIAKQWLFLGVGLVLLTAALLIWLRNDLLAFYSGLKLFKLSVATSQEVTKKTQSENLDLDLSPLVANWSQAEKYFGQLAQSYPNSVLAKKWLKPNDFEQIKAGFELISPLIKTLNQKQTWLVMLQNSNELRASGGFMGSYALVTIDQGKINQFVIEDVYDADGQWQGFIEAPRGVKEYLSAGKGLRLPDANWAADFPSAATQVKFFIESAKQTPIDGVIALNVQVLSQLLEITGPIKLNDYNLTLTADNIDDLLQDRPQIFFPGSRQKVNVLSQTKTQLALAIKQLPDDQYAKLLQLMQTQIKQKNLLFFSNNILLENSLSRLKLTGELPALNLETGLIYLLESNVGINKVNQWIKRVVTLDLASDQATINIDFVNQADEGQEKNGSIYVNYQRLIIPKDWQVKTVEVNDQPADWRQDFLVAEGRPELQQVGWLLLVKPKSQTRTQIILNYGQQKPKNIKILKQPGLKDSDYIIIGQNLNLNFELTEDKLIKLD